MRDPVAGNSVPDRVASAGIALAVAGAAGQSAIHLFVGWVLDYRYGGIILNVAEDESVFGWVSTAVTFGAALGVMLYLATGRRGSWAGPVALAAIIAFWSLDDFIQLHERVGGLWEPLGLWEKADRLVWPVFLLPLLVATFVLALRLSAEIPARASRLVRVGLILIVAAVGLEVASQVPYQLGAEDRDLPVVLGVVAEEAAELAGWILIATGFFVAACARLIAIGSAMEGSPAPRRGESHAP